MIRSPIAALLAAALVLCWSWGAAADDGARRFLLPNLPDLGRTPLGTGSDPNVGAFLTAQSQAHNAALASEAAILADEEDLTILVLDIERALDTLLDAGTVFANVIVPCLIQQDAGPIIDTGVCSGPGGMGFDAGANGGALFWELIHPTSNAHALIAFQAFGTVSGALQGDGGRRDLWAWR